MRRTRWALAAAAVLVVGGIAAWSRCPARSTRPRPPRRRRRAPRRWRGATLSAMVSQGGILTYRARSGRLAVRRDQPGPRRSTPSCPRAGTRSAAATCSTGSTTGRCCCCAARSRPTATCTWAMQGKDVRQLNRNLHARGAGDAPSPRGRSRRSGRSSATRALSATGALATRRRGLPARGGADRRGDRRARGSARPGAPVAQRHLRHAGRAGGPRRVAAGRGQEGRPRADHAAGQHAGDGKGGRASDASPRPRPDRTAGRPPRPSRPSSGSTTRRRRAGSTRPRSRWRSRPRAWRTP